MKNLASKYSHETEVLADFSLFGLEGKQEESYPGAGVFGSQFKRCTILKETPTYYSSSSAKKE